MFLDLYSETWFDSLWRLSLIPSVGEKVREHGAALVEAKDGSLTVAVARPGSSEAFKPDDREMQLNDFRGYFHTHPYESGTTGVAFSPDDFSAAINRQMPLLIAQSGDDLFMLVRTSKTPGYADRNQVKTEFDKWKVYYQKQQREKFQDAVLLANTHIYRKYSLAFYYGKMHQPLQRRM